ncbi:MAG: NAD(P)-dependent alcohol dehydrogenase [Sphaerochaetaceae bacterium]
MDRSVAYLTAIGQLEIREESVPKLGTGDVLVQIKAVGICGSDLSYYLTGCTGVGALSFPHVLGHESAGIVVATGSEIKTISIGDRVALEPGMPCGTCYHCRGGHYNRCESISFMSTARKQPYSEGAFVTYSIRPAHMVHLLPDDVSFEQGAMVEPLSVAIHAIEQSQIRMGQRVAIIGCGPIAGCLLLVLRAIGIGNIIMTDIIEDRLQRMKGLGASQVINTAGMSIKELALIAKKHVDVVFDTSCNETAINAGIHWLDKGGRLMLIGVPSGYGRIDLQTLFLKEGSINTSFRYVNSYPVCISMIEHGLLNPIPLVTHYFPFDEISEAFALAASKQSSVMKVMITV